MKSIEIKINIAEHNGMFKTNIEFTPVSACHPPPPTHTHTPIWPPNSISSAVIFIKPEHSVVNRCYQGVHWNLKINITTSAASVFPCEVKVIERLQQLFLSAG